MATPRLLRRQQVVASRPAFSAPRRPERRRLSPATSGGSLSSRAMATPRLVWPSLLPGCRIAAAGRVLYCMTALRCSVPDQIQSAGALLRSLLIPRLRSLVAHIVFLFLFLRRLIDITNNL
ncbi:hypothetical protein ZWY2020_034993 [Hordeum vulgare]|nr:hypothetical protein ZWY2020_034993 [Hordeum vulgare]